MLSGDQTGLIVISIGAARYLLRLAFAILRTDIELVLAGRIGVVGDPFSVGRPDRVALVGVGSFAEVTGGAFLHRHGEKIAARHHDDAFPIGREIDRFDVLRRIDEGSTAGSEIFLDFDRDRRGLAAGQIVTPDVTRFFEDDRVLAD